MKYYVIYSYFSEYNQFEGNWDVRFETFKTKESALKWIESVKNDGNFKQLIGPLTLA